MKLRNQRHATHDFLSRNIPAPAPGWMTAISSVILLAFPATSSLAVESVAQVQRTAAQWRAQGRYIDLHQHIDYTPERLKRAVGIMDAAGIGTAVNLSGGYVTAEPGKPSEFERNKGLAKQVCPGRFVHYFNLDYSHWDAPDWRENATWQVNEAFRLGAAGLKEFKRLGLYLRDREGRLLRIDDPKLDVVWSRCGELGLPVSIHVADPQAFWKPYDQHNERWTELKDHKNWWFGDPAKFPPFQDLLDALDRVIARHPKTTFVCVHFANNAEDLEWVDSALSRRPNMMADLAARIPEIGRHAPEKVRALFLKHQDRILLASDFQVYDELTLGSGGSGPQPTDADAVEFFRKHWRWLETNDRQFPHMTPIQGDWRIDAIGLPSAVIRKVCFDNARRLLVRSLPPPVAMATFITKDFKPDGRLSKPVWKPAKESPIEYTLRDGKYQPEVAGTTRLLWSDSYLYVGFDVAFTALNEFLPPLVRGEREGLWERDVVEIFIGTDPSRPHRYTEYEVAPTGEKLDLLLDKPSKGLAWDSGFEAAVHLDKKRRHWTTEMRIPLSALAEARPKPGDVWRINLYRHASANKLFLAWSPTATGTAHTPDRFGYLQFAR